MLNPNNKDVNMLDLSFLNTPFVQEYAFPLNDQVLLELASANRASSSKTSHHASNSTGSTKRPNRGSSASNCVSSLKFDLPPLSPKQGRAYPAGTPPPVSPTTDNSNDVSSSSGSAHYSTAAIAEPEVLFVNHMNDEDIADTFYENTSDFDRRVFGEFFFGTNLPDLSISKSLTCFTTAALENQGFQYEASAEARQIEASLAIPTSAYNQEMIAWAHRHNISTSSECFTDLLRVIRKKEEEAMSANSIQRGVKRDVPRGFQNPPAKAICKEIPRQLGAAPKRRNGTTDPRWWKRVFQQWIPSKAITAKTAWF